MRARLLLPFVSALSLWAANAHAIDTQACLAASEKGQHARAAGRLREARDQFNICGADACPGIVRRDCAQWQEQVVALLPGVVFGAKDKAGRDLFDVTVSMDGEVLTKKLDGKAVSVDPGPHTFKFEVAGLPAVVEKSLVKEGEKARVLSVTFDAGEPPKDPNGEGAKPPPPPPPGGDSGGGHTVFPWIVAGVGAVTIVVGVVIIATAPARPNNCDKGSQTCTRAPSETDAQLANDQDRAGKADSQPVVGIGVAAVGALALAGGLLWHFLEPTHEASAGVQVAPWLSPHANGLTLGAKF
ncbi:MAG TPA: hypothetical protein VIF62_04520 [Labilithrix sp.]|jgi:hypothetical protein